MPRRLKKKRQKENGASVKKSGVPVFTLQAPFPAHRDWLWALLLLLAVFVVYSPVWRAGYIWDDDVILTANHCIIGPLGFTDIWTTTVPEVTPVTRSTFWLEHALWGLAPLPYHLVNVLMHGACGILLWQVLRSLLIPGAWLGAALWALHPVSVESVAWIAEMKNTESGVFYLLTIIFYVKWLRANPTGKSRGEIWSYVLTLLFAALALGSKASTVILPVVLCLVAWWVEGRWRWRNLAGVLPILFMAMAETALSIWGQKSQLIPAQTVLTWPDRLVTAADAVWFYLGKLLWPYPLVMIYPHWQMPEDHGISCLPLLAITILAIVFWLKRESWSRPWFFTLAYFLVALLPVLGFTDNTFFGYSLVFDHLQYLASMAPLALIAAGLVRLGRHLNQKQPWVVPGLSAVLMLALALTSWSRVWAFESEETLWRDTLAKSPACWAAHSRLGLVLSSQGQLELAQTEFETAAAIHPDEVTIHMNLGSILLQKGETEKALDQYRQALKINPRNAEVHYNLGVFAMKVGKLDEAIEYFQRALELDPYSSRSYNNLGNILLQKGNPNGALDCYRSAVRIDPQSTTFHVSLGNGYLQVGLSSEAIAEYREALKISPGSAEAHYNLGLVLLQSGQLDEATTEYHSALEIDPGNRQLHDQLAESLLSKGHLDAAASLYQQDLKLNPDDAIARDHLAQTRKKADQK